ncbi:MAG TPA: hypothetical protein VJK51_03975 [Candidatus Nanoarchaeia archaeon]|nr:hypothetical protein [Candidatus Nanoarchaeia archaeon]
MSWRERVFTLLGIWYILLGIVALFNSYYYFEVDQVYWFCYLGMFLLGIGLLWRNGDLLVVQFTILAGGLLFWTLDFSYRLLSGNDYLGISSYFFEDGSLIPKLVTLQHVYTIPVVLYALSILKIKGRRLWVLSFLEAVILYFLTFFFTSPEYNVNCVFYSCIRFFDLQLYYPYIWFLLVFLMIFVTHFIVMRLPFVQSRR